MAHQLTSRASHAMLKPLQLASIGSGRAHYAAQQDKDVDVAIVGGGIVGTASALELKTRFPALQVLIIEKESELGKLSCQPWVSQDVHTGLQHSLGFCFTAF